MTQSEIRENPRPGRPKLLDDFDQGQLVMCLSLGLTQRETAAWIQSSQSSVSYLLRHDEKINEQVRRYTELGLRHPFLRLRQAAGRSWRAAARLLTRIDETQGPLTTDELMAALELLREKVQVMRHA
jgi:hypothetical protein